MRITPPSSWSTPKKAATWLAAGLMLCTCGYLAYQWSLPSPQSTPNEQPRQFEQQAAQSKQQFNDAARTSSAHTDASKDDATPQPAETQPAPVKPSHVSLRAQTESQAVTIFTRLHQIGTGTCELTVRHNDQVVQQSAQVIYQPEFSSCAGFSVPISQLGSGEWQIQLRVVSGSSAAEKTITHKVGQHEAS